MKTSLASWLLGPSAARNAHDDFWFNPLGTSTHAGIPVTEESSLRHSPIQCGVRLISSLVASMPEVLYRRLGDERKERARDNSLYRVLHDQPNSWQTRFEHRQMQTAQLVMNGNYLDEIMPTRAGAVGELHPIPWKYVKADRVRATKRRVYDIQGGYDGNARTLTQDQAHHGHLMSLDGLQGMSPIGMAREDVSLGLALGTHAQTFFGRGAKPLLALSTDKTLKTDQRERNRAEFDQQHAGPYDAHKTMVLEGGWKTHVLSISNEDSQFLESRRFSVADAGRILGIPLHLLMEHDKTSSWGTGVAEQTMAFQKYTLGYYVGVTEQAISRDLILDPEQFFVQFLFEALLRADIETRYKVYETGIRNSMLTPDQALAKENMDPRPDGRGHLYRREANVVIDDGSEAPAERRATPPPAAKSNGTGDQIGVS